MPMAPSISLLASPAFSWNSHHNIVIEVFVFWVRRILLGQGRTEVAWVFANLSDRYTEVRIEVAYGLN